MPTPQYRYWMCTLWEPAWEPELFSDELAWIKGQKEKAPSTGNLHWQLIFGYKKKVSKKRILDQLTVKYGSEDLAYWGDIQPTNSAAADEYVWKDETAVEGTRFELGRYLILSNLSENLCDETMPPTGDISIVSQKRVVSRKSLRPRRMLSSDTMDLLRESYKITFERLSEEALLPRCSGAIQELEKHTEHLKKLRVMLILRDQLASGGTVTDKKQMLSLMNSQDASESNTCSDGSTGSPVLLKSKEAPSRLKRLGSGLPPILTQTNGTTTPTLLKNNVKRLRED